VRDMDFKTPINFVMPQLGSLGVEHAWVGEREKVIIYCDSDCENRSRGATGI
jgi:hypothetical protein